MTDQPGGPRLLDPRTVLGWVAGQTERICLSASVQVLAQPVAVLARAAASLDLTAAQALIDKAAAGAGRDPREIRRLARISGRFARSPEGFPGGHTAADIMPGGPDCPTHWWG